MVRLLQLLSLFEQAVLVPAIF